MLSDRVDEAMHRSVLLRLAEIVLTCIDRKIRPEGGTFDHKFMSDGEAATWLLCTLQLARRTVTGFEALAPKANRAARVAAVPTEDLPLLEDAIEATIIAHDDVIPMQTAWPPGPDIFPKEFESVFGDLGLQEESGIWKDAALPILVWNECFTAEAIRSDAVAGSIGQLARRALDSMPPAVLDVIVEDDQKGKPGQRLPDYLSNSWRPEGWLTPVQRRVARTYTGNPLAHAVAREIMRLRGTAQT